jgi:hypothetical protein
MMTKTKNDDKSKSQLVAAQGKEALTQKMDSC